jgi:hypothetical protein
MPRDGLSLPVGVGGQPHGLALLGGLADGSNRLLDVGLRQCLIAEVDTAVDVDAEIGFGEVADMPHRGKHSEILAHVLLDRPRLGR